MEDDDITCVLCDGLGSQSCYMCDGLGSVDCRFCTGAGCDECDGYGLEDCAFCEGIGRTDCSDCGGSGINGEEEFSTIEDNIDVFTSDAKSTLIEELDNISTTLHAMPTSLGDFGINGKIFSVLEEAIMELSDEKATELVSYLIDYDDE